MKRSVLHEDGSKISAALVERRLDYGTRSPAVRVCLEFKQVSFQKNLLQELVHVDTLLSRDFLALVFSAPVLYEDVHVGELLTNPFRIGSRFVYLVDCKDHRDSCSLCMVDCLDGLRHDCVIGSDDDDCKVGHLCSAGTHRREGLVTRGVEEGDVSSVRELHVVCTDVLGDTTGLTGNHISLADVVQKGCLTMVDVTHDGNHRRS